MREAAVASTSAAAATAAGAGQAGLGTRQLAGDQAAAAGTEATASEMMESVSDAEFSLAVEVAYHDARQAFFEAAHRWAMFLAILLGTSAVTKFGSENALGLVAAMVAAADIAFDFTGRAQRHADLRRRYYELVADVAKLGADAADFAARWMLISADEPPLYRWAEYNARRNTCINMERRIPEPLALWKTLASHVWRG